MICSAGSSYLKTWRSHRCTAPSRPPPPGENKFARAGLDPWDAHAAAIADVAIYPIRTLDAAKWRQPSAGLDEPLHIIEISDPDERGPEY
jgi:hypothetical protein